MSTKERIGRRIKAIRKQKGLTQAHLAELIDRSEDALSQIERGLNFPHVSTIERISIKLGVPLEVFFDSIEGEKSTPKRAGLQAHLTALTNELDDAGLALAAEIIESIQKQNSK